ncbi:Uncharacterised protein [uncultured archaeon]|nr:Uncharacterised protein [uncultured archaeon]
MVQHEVVRLPQQAELGEALQAAGVELSPMQQRKIGSAVQLLDDFNLNPHQARILQAELLRLSHPEVAPMQLRPLPAMARRSVDSALTLLRDDFQITCQEAGALGRIIEGSLTSASGQESSGRMGSRIFGDQVVGPAVAAAAALPEHRQTVALLNALGDYGGLDFQGLLLNYVTKGYPPLVSDNFGQAVWVGTFIGTRFMEADRAFTAAGNEPARQRLEGAWNAFPPVTGADVNSRDIALHKYMLSVRDNAYAQLDATAAAAQERHPEMRELLRILGASNDVHFHVRLLDARTGDLKQENDEYAKILGALAQDYERKHPGLPPEKDPSIHAIIALNRAGGEQLIVGAVRNYVEDIARTVGPQPTTGGPPSAAPAPGSDSDRTLGPVPPSLRVTQKPRINLTDVLNAAQPLTEVVPQRHEEEGGGVYYSLPAATYDAMLALRRRTDEAFIQVDGSTFVRGDLNPLQTEPNGRIYWRHTRLLRDGTRVEYATNGTGNFPRYEIALDSDDYQILATQGYETNGEVFLIDSLGNPHKVQDEAVITRCRQAAAGFDAGNLLRYSLSVDFTLGTNELRYSKIANLQNPPATRGAIEIYADQGDLTIESDAIKYWATQGHESYPVRRIEAAPSDVPPNISLRPPR